RKVRAHTECRAGRCAIPLFSSRRDGDEGNARALSRRGTALPCPQRHAGVAAMTHQTGEVVKMTVSACTDWCAYGEYAMTGANQRGCGRAAGGAVAASLS